MRRFLAAFPVGLVVAALFHCGTDKAAQGPGCDKDGVTIKFGEQIFCRCVDQREGSQTCQEDGKFDSCSPCDAVPHCSATVTAGQTTDCTCNDGQNGTKLCKDDATFDTCVCDPLLEGGTPDAPAGCGDGTVDTNEACDDGNKTNGDLCDSTCKPNGDPAAAGTCPGMPVDVWTGRLDITGKTTPYGSAHTGTTCGGSNGAGGKDRVYAVTPHKAGTLKVTVLTADFNNMIYLRTTCDQAASEVKCANTSASTAGETLSNTVEAGKTYFVWIDGGVSNTGGNFTLRFEIL